MTGREPTTTTNLDRYGFDALPWSRPLGILKENTATPDITWFLGTVHPDGRPHAAGIGALWHEDELYFTSSPNARKAKDFAANPNATLSARLPTIDLVFEGHVERVTDATTLETVAARYRDGGWPAQVEGDALTAPFSAPSAGPPPWNVYRLVFDVVFGVATAEPYGATKWTFSG
jgi:pyridoxamine 5'-phosphate oxidase-like protein